MFGKVALVLSVCAAILQPPLALPVPPCCAAPDAQRAVLADGCCAAMTCCVISDTTARQPINPAPLTNNIAAFPALVTLVSPIAFPANSRELRGAQAPPVAHSPPPLALLCARLI